MKKFLLFIIIGILLIGGYYIFDKRSNRIEDINNNPVVQSHRSYKISLLSGTDNLKPTKRTQLKFKITDETGATLKNFELDHTKIMHFITVRKDLQDFQHLHPEFDDRTGEFTVPLAFTENGKYRLFADFVPANGQKGPDGKPLTATPYTDVIVGNSQYNPKKVLPDTQLVKTEGEYTLTYKIAQSLRAGTPISIVINVMKNGQPVTDMEQYLGAQAHGILLKKDNLEFAHLHAMGTEMTHKMNGETMTMHTEISKGPEIKFDYTFAETGIYKLFTQFQHEGKVITTAYTLEVK